MQRNITEAIIFLAGALLGCKACEETTSGAASAVTAAASARTPATSEQTPAGGSQTPTTAAASATVSAGGAAVPTLPEWNAAGEVTVKGSSALGCETKIVRDWFRCSCRGKNDSGGTPAGVTVARGGRGQARTYAAGQVTSLVVPYASGAHVEAVFSWTDKSHKLVLDWPAGAPRPDVAGVFEGAASPLDRPGGGRQLAMQARECECERQTSGITDCEQISGLLDEDCYRTWGHDCQALVECARGEPGRRPTCLAGYRLAGTGWCYKLCGSDRSCPAAHTCSSDWGEPPVCMPD
ncbi:MAG: hypothetical protein HY744_19720 [Deltaproteobacteria bacterium]|nr:hypothetical protein [Deltaproteobacteria bacterium]